MLVTRQPILRKFWYPVIPRMLLKDGPKPFTLLGRDLVLWLDGDGTAVAMDDRCPHRHAKLSKGWIQDGQLLCGYHGWTYNAEGRCTRIPQKGDDDPSRISVPRHRTAERFGYVWVALEDPISPLPHLEEDGAPGMRRIYEFYEPWKCSGLRLMENSFDNAHFSFVHRNTFGKLNAPEPSRMNLSPFPDGFGFTMDTVVPVKNVPLSQRSLNMPGVAETVRNNTGIWWMPFCRKLRMRYPTGLIHTIFTAATPIDDHTSQIVQIAYRSDTEAEARAADIIAFDRAVVTEDRDILESTTYDTPVDLSRREELHMASDAPGLLMRRQLLAKFSEHGEAEAHGAGSDPFPRAGHFGVNLPLATEAMCLEMTYAGAPPAETQTSPPAPPSSVIAGS